MSIQTLTLSLPETTLHDVEAIAARRQITVAQLATEALEALIAREHLELDTNPQDLAQRRQPEIGNAPQREPLYERYAICGLKIRVPEQFAKP